MSKLFGNTLFSITSLIIFFLPFLETNVHGRVLCKKLEGRKLIYRVFLDELKFKNVPNKDHPKLQNQTLSDLRGVGSRLSGKVKQIEKNKKKNIEVSACPKRDPSNEYTDPDFAKQNQKKKIVLEIMGEMADTRPIGLNKSTIKFYTFQPPDKRLENDSSVRDGAPEAKVMKTDINLYGFRNKPFALTDKRSIYSAYLNIGLGMYHFRLGKKGHASSYLLAAAQEFETVIKRIKETISKAKRKVSVRKNQKDQTEKTLENTEGDDFRIYDHLDVLKREIRELNYEIDDMEQSMNNLIRYQKEACEHWKSAKEKRDSQTEVKGRFTLSSTSKKQKRPEASCPSQVARVPNK